MMPEACASMRSMARWVLPVFVGPRTALTRAVKPESKPGMGRWLDVAARNASGVGGKSVGGPERAGTGSGGVRAADGPSIMARRTAGEELLAFGAVHVTAGAARQGIGISAGPPRQFMPPSLPATGRARPVLGRATTYARRRCGIRAIAAVRAERCGQPAALVNQRSRGRSVAQPGSASVWGTGGRGFKSRRSDQRFQELHLPPASPCLA